MAKYRAIHTKIWKDPHFEEYSLEAKLIFIYLCSNECVTESGIYPISERTISNETGIPLQTVDKLLANGCMRNIEYDFDNKIVFIRNFRKYAPTGGRTDLMIKSIQKDFLLTHKSYLWHSFLGKYPHFTDDLQTLDKPLANPLPTIVESSPLFLNAISKAKAKAKGISKDIPCHNKVAPACPYQKIISLYHEKLPELQCMDFSEWTQTQKNRIRKIWLSKPGRNNLHWWEMFFEGIKHMPMLMGQIKDWQADLLWMIKPENFSKIIQGKYLQKEHELKKKLGDLGYKNYKVLMKWMEESDE